MRPKAMAQRAEQKKTIGSVTRKTRGRKSESLTKDLKEKPSEEAGPLRSSRPVSECMASTLCCRSCSALVSFIKHDRMVEIAATIAET